MKNTSLMDKFMKDIEWKVEERFDYYYSLDEVDEYNITENIFNELTTEYKIEENEEEDLWGLIAEVVDEHVEMLKEQIEIAKEYRETERSLNRWIYSGVA